LAAEVALDQDFQVVEVQERLFIMQQHLSLLEQ
jgi:hypothetical protein